MLYNYTLKTKIGEAFGTVEADSDEEATAVLIANHAGTYIDEEGNEQQNQVVNMQLEILSQNQISDMAQ